MRAFLWTIYGLLVFCAVAFAQQPGNGGSPIIPAPGTGGTAPGRLMLNPNNRLDSLLMKWEARMMGVESIHVQDCVRTDKDKTGEKHWKGEARYLKPNLAALRLVQQEDKTQVEMMISTGNFLYEYRAQFKKLVVHEMAPSRNGNFDNNLLGFLFGMNAADAKNRYDLTLSKDVSEQNPHYIYIDIKPRYEADKREFARAQMVLFAETMLPRRIWFEKANGDQMTLDLPNMDTTKKLVPSDFSPVPPPQGWDTVREPLQPAAAPNDGKPRIIRQAPDR